VTVRGLPYLCAVVLAAAFAGSAVAKARDRPGTARGLRALGLGHPYRLAAGLVVVEAALALGLLVVAPLAAPAAAAVLAAFTVFLHQRLRAGTTAPCACFGRWGAAPLTAAELLRNGWLLVACAGAALADGPQWPSVGAVAVVVATAALAAASVRLVRRRSSPIPLERP
jgi:hypothetical protein